MKTKRRKGSKKEKKKKKRRGRRELRRGRKVADRGAEERESDVTCDSLRSDNECCSPTGGDLRCGSSLSVSFSLSTRTANYYTLGRPRRRRCDLRRALTQREKPCLSFSSFLSVSDGLSDE